MQREMYAKQNTFGYSVIFSFFISDPPAVIVIAEVILQDVCEMKSLISVFTLFFLNIVFPCVSFNIYNKTKLSYRQQQ